MISKEKQMLIDGFVNNINNEYGDGTINAAQVKAAYAHFDDESISLERVKKEIENNELRFRASHANKTVGINENYDKVKAAYLDISKNEVLSDKLYIYGGTIPYIMSGKTPKRKISDVDTYAKAEDMELIRTAIYQNQANYKIISDSLSLLKEDYGFVFGINDMPVSISPTIDMPDGLYVKSYEYEQTTKHITTKTTMYPDVMIDELKQDVAFGDNKVNILIPEFTYVIKRIANKPKDLEDIDILDTIVDHGRLNLLGKRLANSFDVSEHIIDLNEPVIEVESNTGGRMKSLGVHPATRSGFIDALLLALITGMFGGFFLTTIFEYIFR